MNLYTATLPRSSPTYTDTPAAQTVPEIVRTIQEAQAVQEAQPTGRAQSVKNKT